MLPEASDELEISDAHDEFIGVYKNKKGWPEISIIKNNSKTTQRDIQSGKNLWW